MRREFSSGFIIFLKEDNIIKYLLLHYESGHWDFPKGKIEEGENKHQAAIRELKEETGLKCEIITGFEKSFSYFFKNKSGELISKEVTLFLGEVNSQEVKLSYEHIGYKWLDYTQAYNRVTYPNAREALKLANEFLKTYLNL